MNQSIVKYPPTFSGGGGGLSQHVFAHVGGGIIDEFVLIMGSRSGRGTTSGGAATSGGGTSSDMSHKAVGEDAAVLRECSNRQ